MIILLMILFDCLPLLNYIISPFRCKHFFKWFLSTLPLRMFFSCLFFLYFALLMVVMSDYIVFAKHTLFPVADPINSRDSSWITGFILTSSSVKKRTHTCLFLVNSMNKVCLPVFFVMLALFYTPFSVCYAIVSYKFVWFTKMMTIFRISKK